MTEEKTFQVHVHHHKNGAIRAEVKNGNHIVKEIWQDPLMNPKVTLHALRKQVEMEVWSDKI